MTFCKIFYVIQSIQPKVSKKNLEVYRPGELSTDCKISYCGNGDYEAMKFKDFQHPLTSYIKFQNFQGSTHFSMTFQILETWILSSGTSNEVWPPWIKHWKLKNIPPADRFFTEGLWMMKRRRPMMKILKSLALWLTNAWTTHGGWMSWRPASLKMIDIWQRNTIQRNTFCSQAGSRRQHR